MPAAEFNCDAQQQPSWHDRARVAAALLEHVVPRRGAPVVVLDIGCGDMKLLQQLRAAGSAAHYQGLDLHPQAAQVLPYDVRTQPLPQPCDAAVLLGVVEYLEAPAEVLRRLARETRYLVASHVVSDNAGYDAAQLRRLNWKTHMTRGDFAALLAGCGFEVLREATTANRKTVLWLCAAPAR